MKYKITKKEVIEKVENKLETYYYWVTLQSMCLCLTTTPEFSFQVSIPIGNLLGVGSILDIPGSMDCDCSSCLGVIGIIPK
jgi:hypothetical protein